MFTCQKQQPEVQIQLPETTKIGAESATMSGPLVSQTAASFASGRGDFFRNRRKTDMLHTFLRLLCLVTAIAALCFMVTAEASGTISVLGLELPVYSKWSFSDSFDFLVGISSAVTVHSLVQLLLSGEKLLRKLPVIPSRNYAWLIFAGDQAFAYAMMSAGSAAAGVTNLNRTGIRHSALPDFCKPLHRFCDRATISITFAFFSFLLLATSAALDVLWLSSY